MSAFTVIIPARYGAMRLPGKPLCQLAGQPVIEHVWKRACESGAERVIVATDDQRIEATVRQFGGDVCLTRSDHLSGTDRLTEVVTKRQLPADDIIVNLQGDEPLMPPSLLNQVASTLAAAPTAAMATLATAITDPADYADPHTVKVVNDHQGRALYFSRAAIPHTRDSESDSGIPTGALRHLGIYAYRVSFLQRYADLPNSPLEALEQLEQLRALQAGEWIQVAHATQSPGPGIDTPADLRAAEAQINALGT